MQRSLKILFYVVKTFTKLWNRPKIGKAKCKESNYKSNNYSVKAKKIIEYY